MISARPLSVRRLSRENFQAFGDVIEVSDAARHFTINGGSTERYHDLANINPGKEGRAIVSIFRGQPRTLPYAIQMMERHPLASQAFMPLNGVPYLVAVAAADTLPDVDNIQVFLASGQQGVNYAAGVWHHPLMAIGQVCDFLVIDRAGEGLNCDEYQLPATAYGVIGADAVHALLSA